MCHRTPPDGPYPRARPAIRGFYDRYDIATLQIIGRLFGSTHVDPPTTQ